MPSISSSNSAVILRFLNQNAEDQQKYLTQLSSGKIAADAGDDPAGVAIAMQLNADVVVADQVAINATQGTTLLQTADGGLSNIGDALTQMQSLAAQAMNGALSTADRAALDVTYQALAAEVDNIASSTEFNGQQLLDGSYTNQQFLLGLDPATAGAISTISIDNSDIATLVGGGAGDVTTVGNATTAFGNMQTALDNLALSRAQVGADISSFEFRSDIITTAGDALDEARSAQEDVDIAQAQSDYSNAEALTLSAVYALAQQNELPRALIELLTD